MNNESAGKGILNKLAALYVAWMPYSLAVTLLGVAVLFFIWLFWQPVSKNERIADNTNTNAEVHATNTAVADAKIEAFEQRLESMQQEISGIEATALQAEETARIALSKAESAKSKLNQVVSQDSSQSTGDAGKRFCERFPLDSSCQVK